MGNEMFAVLKLYDNEYKRLDMLYRAQSNYPPESTQHISFGDKISACEQKIADLATELSDANEQSKLKRQQDEEEENAKLAASVSNSVADAAAAIATPAIANNRRRPNSTNTVESTPTNRSWAGSPVDNMERV